MTEQERYIPHDHAAEVGVLGGILVHGAETMAAISSILEPEDFYQRQHKSIYLAMVQLWDHGEPVDEITLSSYLSDQDKLVEAGGESYLAELADTILGPAQTEHYASLVRKKSELRQIAAAARQAQAAALVPGADPETAIAEAERIFLAGRERKGNGRAVKLGELLPGLHREFENRRTAGRDPNALPCGFKALDQLLGGGMRPGDMICGAGRTSMGKTSFGLSVAINVGVNQGKTVLFCSREQPANQLAGLMLCAWSQVSTQAWRSGRVSPEGKANLSFAVKRLEVAPIYFFDSSADMAQVRSRARLLKAKNNLALLIFDHIQRFARSGKPDDIGEVSRNLKDLAIDLSVPVLALSQINREVAKGTDPTPRIEHLKGSGTIEEDSDVILLFYRPGYYDKAIDPGLTKVMVGKQRNGPTGLVRLQFRPEFVRFEDGEATDGMFD